MSLTCAPLSVGLIRALGSTSGYRASGLLGTAVLTLSCLASSFVQQPEWLFLTHSLLYGVGSSLVYMTSSLVIGDHFCKDHKYHVLATSILLCGYPLGIIRLIVFRQQRVAQNSYQSGCSQVICHAKTIEMIADNYYSFLNNTPDQDPMERHNLSVVRFRVESESRHNFCVFYLLSGR